MDDWVRSVHEAAERDEVIAAVEGIYRELEVEIEKRRPVCSASGRCCRFGQYGHRLYVTTIELSAFVRALPGAKPQGDAGEQTCPLQVGGLCSVHAIRPFGCRVFFCDETAEQWQREQYEQFHGRLRRLHEELKVPYRYVEWLSALIALGLVSGEAAQRRSPLPSPARLSSPKSGLPGEGERPGQGRRILSLPQLPL